MHRLELLSLEEQLKRRVAVAAARVECSRRRLPRAATRADQHVLGPRRRLVPGPRVDGGARLGRRTHAALRRLRRVGLRRVGLELDHAPSQPLRLVHIEPRAADRSLVPGANQTIMGAWARI